MIAKMLASPLQTMALCGTTVIHPVKLRNVTKRALKLVIYIACDGIDHGADHGAKEQIAKERQNAKQ